MLDRKLKIAVLAGGIGSERQVSFLSGDNITNAISQAGGNVIQSDITPDDLSILEDRSIDVFFLALHGKFGEDGQIQDIMEQRNLRYTGSGPKASRISFDKAISKRIFRENGINVAWDICVDGKADLERIGEEMAKVGDKFVIKPIREGSSVGVEIVKGIGQALDAAAKCAEKFDDCMVEKFIAGKEITVGIVNGRALPIIEIVSKAGFYDYHAKYIDDETKYLFDTIKDKDLVEKISRVGVKCFNALGCRHLARVDMMMDNDGLFYVLEVNTLPGFTSHSLLPMAAAKAGITMSRLCMEIIEAAMETFDKRSGN